MTISLFSTMDIAPGHRDVVVVFSTGVVFTQPKVALDPHLTI